MRDEAVDATVTYATATHVSDLLQLPQPFGANTRPSLSQVNKLLQRATERIDQYTRHAWRARRVTDALYDFNAYGFGIGYVGAGVLGETESRMFIDLQRRSIRALTAPTHKLRLYQGGGTYFDLLASGTAGRGNDYYIDSEKGYVYFNNRVPAYRYNALDTTFDYGDTTVPLDIEEACTKLVSIEIVRSNDYTLLFPGGGNDMIDLRDRAAMWDTEVKEILNRRQELVYVM